MRYLIVEDEGPAAEQLRREMKALEPGAECVGVCESVAATLEFLEAQGGALDLILCDVQLADGSSLEIFDRVHVPCPVVFCTAYDDYVMEALQKVGVDYLLKPIERGRLALALSKIKTLAAHFRDAASLEASAPASSAAPRRLLGKRGASWHPLSFEDIAYFVVADKVVSAFNFDGEEYVVDGSLAEIEARVDPRDFFRANRRHLIALGAVGGFRTLGKGRLRVDLRASDEAILVSQENARRFRAWLEGA